MTDYVYESKDMKLCGTCSYWDGVRKLDGANNLYVETNGNGRCANPHSFAKNTQIMKNSSCQEFEVWCRLK